MSEADRERFMTLASNELENVIYRFGEEFCLSDQEIIGLLMCYASVMSVQSMGYLVDLDEEEEEDDD